MSSSTITETKNGLSAILSALADGREMEHIIRRRDVPVAVIRPYSARPAEGKPFGFAADDGKDIDWDAFDATDAEVAEMFGI